MAAGAQSRFPYQLRALAVAGPEMDQASLELIFHSMGWDLFRARSRLEALECLESNALNIVITESEFPGGTWREILGDLMEFRNPPLLLVTSRLADDALWAEVLNMGGFDVLAQPLDAEEVTRVVSAAQRHFQNALEWSRLRERPRPLAASAD